ncbi:hypothetical protein JHK85_004540 [Glycine max]|nr:hypothetical protein JHK85_004540 [Glycine max]
MEEKDWNDDSLTMTTVSHHCFSDDSKAPSFSISIIENMKDEYGLFLWPCNVVLVEYVWQHNHRFSGANVVEVLGLTWGVWDSSIFSLQSTIILGADVLYDSNGEKKIGYVSYLSPSSVYWTKVLFLMYYLAFDNLFATVTFLFRNSPGGHHLIEFWVGKWGLECLKLLDGFSFLPSDKASLFVSNWSNLPYFKGDQ